MGRLRGGLRCPKARECRHSVPSQVLHAAESMKFSVAYSCSTTHLLGWSPNGHYLAVPDNNKLYIKDGMANSLVMSFTCYDTIKLMEWSPDSSLILTGTPSSNTTGNKCPCVQVWSTTDPEWRCIVKLGSAGLLKASWAPDSKHLIITEAFHVRIGIWSLVNTSLATIKNPIEVISGLQFSCDGSYLAAAERINSKDHLTILETKTWQLVKQFPVCTQSLGGIAWGCGGDSGTGTILAVWDGILSYNVTLYAMCGRILSSIMGAETYGLGVRGLAWAPSGRHLVIGGQDTKLCVVNHMTWDISSEQMHSPIIDDQDPPITTTTTTTTISSSTSTSVTAKKDSTGVTVTDNILTNLSRHRVNVYKEVTKEVPSVVWHGELQPPHGTMETAYECEPRRPILLAFSNCPSPSSAPLALRLHPPVCGGFSTGISGRGILNSIEAKGVSGGVTTMLYSSCGRYLATMVQQLPCVVWVWQLPALTLQAVLVHDTPVRDLSWSPRQPRLAVCTAGNSNVFMWTSIGLLTVTPSSSLQLQPGAVRWHPSGQHLLVVCGSGTQFSICSLGRQQSQDATAAAGRGAPRRPGGAACH